MCGGCIEHDIVPTPPHTQTHIHIEWTDLWGFLVGYYVNNYASMWNNGTVSWSISSPWPCTYPERGPSSKRYNRSSVTSKDRGSLSHMAYTSTYITSVEWKRISWPIQPYPKSSCLTPRSLLATMMYHRPCSW